MSMVGWSAVLLSLACMAVLVHDVRHRRTAFAQFRARRWAQPKVFWLGIAGWGACALGAALVAWSDHVARDPCGGAARCIVISASAP